MSTSEPMDGNELWLSRRLLHTFDISDQLLTKLTSKGFTLKSEIQVLSDSKLQSICDLNEQQMDSIDKVIRNSHKYEIEGKTVDQIQETNSERIKTGSKSLDIALNGGLEVSKITQICGDGGVGKTQLCMQLCINVQMPEQMGGLSGQALYIDTENNLRPERLISMANHCLNTHPELRESFSVESFTSRVHLKPCYTNPKHLVDLIVNQIEPFIEQNPEIRLIVIDSIAQLFRYDYDDDEEVRAYELALIGQKLKLIAHLKKVAILIANQVTQKPTQDQVEPCLGKHWQSSCSTNIMMTRTFGGHREGWLLRSTQCYRNQKFYYNITENGIEEGVQGM